MIERVRKELTLEAPTLDDVIPPAATWSPKRDRTRARETRVRSRSLRAIPRANLKLLGCYSRIRKPFDHHRLTTTNSRPPTPLLFSPHRTSPSLTTPLTASLFLFLLLFLSKLCCEAHRSRLKSASLRSFFHVISKPLTEGSRVRTPHDCDSFTAGN